MTANVFARRLTQLEAILTALPVGAYDHGSWRTCAIGHAMKNRDMFRGLNINLVPITDGIDNGVTLQSDDGVDYYFSTLETAVDTYFGPGAFDGFASGEISSPDGGPFSNPSRDDTVKNIQTFRDSLLAEAA